VSYLTAEVCEQHGTETDGQSLDYRQNDSVSPIGAPVGVEDIDHGRPDDTTGVVEHVHHSESNARCCKVPSVRRLEDVRRGKRMLQVAVGFPQCKQDQEEESDAKRSYDVGVVGWKYGDPDNTHEYGKSARRKQ